MNRIYKDIIYIFILSAVIGIMRSIVLQDIKLIKSAPKVISTVPIYMDEPILIDIELAEELFNSGAIFIDARDFDIYKNGHIKDAINIPWDTIENNKIAFKLESIAFDKSIVIYCSGGDCTLSMDLGDFLFFDIGYEKIYIFESGFSSWVGRNLPLRKYCSSLSKEISFDPECIYSHD